MAVAKYVKDQAVTASSGDNSLIRVQWVLLNGDTGAPLPWAEWSDRTVQLYAQNYITAAASVLGAGPVLSMEGSNDYDPATNPTGSWVILKDTANLPITVSALDLRQITEDCLWVRPHVTGGDGTTSAVVVLSARRIQQQVT
jgi:hypothetical protein